MECLSPQVSAFFCDAKRRFLAKLNTLRRYWRSRVSVEALELTIEQERKQCLLCDYKERLCEKKDEVYFPKLRRSWSAAAAVDDEQNASFFDKKSLVTQIGRKLFYYFPLLGKCGASKSSIDWNKCFHYFFLSKSQMDHGPWSSALSSLLHSLALVLHGGC